MYRIIFCKIALFVTIGLLTACGQSGALMLPSDPNYDKRSQYLLYKNVEQQKLPTDAVQTEIQPTETSSTEQN